jgi:hypothetical protein
MAVPDRLFRYSGTAVAMQYIHRSESGVFTALGMRYGYLESEAQRAVFGIEGSYQERVTYNYFNPYIALESRYFGIGVGYMGGDVPASFGEYSDAMPASAHIRFGNYEKANFLVSLNENLPLASGGGYFNMGIDYPAGRWGTLFTGLSAGFHDGPGFVQKITILVADRFNLDLSARLGSADSNFEGGFAAGLRYHIPLH